MEMQVNKHGWGECPLTCPCPGCGPNMWGCCQTHTSGSGLMTTYGSRAPVRVITDHGWNNSPCLPVITPTINLLISPLPDERPPKAFYMYSMHTLTHTHRLTWACRNICCETSYMSRCSQVADIRWSYKGNPLIFSLL